MKVSSSANGGELQICLSSQKLQLYIQLHNVGVTLPLPRCSIPVSIIAKHPTKKSQGSTQLITSGVSSHLHHKSSKQGTHYITEIFLTHNFPKRIGLHKKTMTLMVHWVN